MNTDRLATRIQGGVEHSTLGYRGRVRITIYDGDIPLDASQDVVEESIRRGDMWIVTQVQLVDKWRSTEQAATDAMRRKASSELRRILAFLDQAGGSVTRQYDFGEEPLT